MIGICDFTVASLPCSTTNAPTCPSPPVPTHASSTATTTTTATTSTTTASPTTFNATKFCATKTVARYADPSDSTCTKYVYCYLNGGIKGAEYSCVGSTLFDPSKGACVTGFTCTGTTSVTSTTSSSQSTTTSALSTTTTMTPTSTTTTPTTTTTTPTTTTTATTTITPLFNANTFCASKAVARYAYPTATNCTKYVYCYLNNGIKGAVYTCPGSTLFNPSLGACASGYVCV